MDERALSLLKRDYDEWVEWRKRLSALEEAGTPNIDAWGDSDDRAEQLLTYVFSTLQEKCGNLGRDRFNLDGTENWCSRDFPNACRICGLHANLD